MADNIIIKDATGASKTMRTVDSGSSHTPVHRIDGYDPADDKVKVKFSGYDPVDDMVKVKSMQKKFRDSFTGAAVDATKWDVVLGTGGTATVAAGQLTFGSGTTINATHTLTSKETFTVPFRVSVGLVMSQRIANAQLFIEAISVNAVTGVPDNLHACGFLFDATTVTQGRYYVQNGGLAALVSGASTFPTTAAGSVYELEPYADEVWFHGGVLDATSGRANSYRRHQQIPEPNAAYKLRLRWINGATAPASNTNAVIQFIACQDYAELTAEITAGRGQTVAGQAIGVAVVSVPTTPVTGTFWQGTQPVSGTVTVGALPVGTNAIGAVSSIDNIFFNESVTAQAASATLTGAVKDVGVAVSVLHRYSAFNASAFADQAGTLRVECSNDNVTWRRTTADTAVAANTCVILSVPIMTRYYRAVYVNGATLQAAFMLNTSFTAA